MTFLYLESCILHLASMQHSRCKMQAVKSAIDARAEYSYPIMSK